MKKLLLILLLSMPVMAETAKTTLVVSGMS